MTVIQIQKLNEVHLRFFCDDIGVESEIVDFFTYEYPGAKYTPQYRARLWDGKVRLADPIRKTLYVGLHSYLIKFAEARNYTLEAINEIDGETDITLEQIQTYVENLNLHSRGAPIDVRDYQLDAINTGLQHYRRVLLSPTGSGKSLIIYIISRWLIDKGHKVLIVVPTTSLVEQMYSDFVDYSSHNNWIADQHLQKIYSGFSKDVEHSPIIITTWQSIYKQPKTWFDQFGAIIGDEAHLYKAKSLTSIMEKMTAVKYKIGTTGSLDDKKVHRLVLEGIFGPVHRVTTTKKLQDTGKLSNLKIRALLFKYTDEIRKANAKLDFPQEIDFLVTNAKRNRFISNLAVGCKGNTLVLFQFVERHGEPLFQQINEKAQFDGRPVYFIHGGIDVEERESIRNVLSSQDNAIVVASFGTMSTGINIPSIENIIFASPTKSVIRVLQSIGRGLRLNTGKTHCTLYDITDDMHWKSWKNHTLKHGAERYKIYAEEGFSVNLIEVNLRE